MFYSYLLTNKLQQKQKRKNRTKKLETYRAKKGLLCTIKNKVKNY